jgi:hypothetical protein
MFLTVLKVLVWLAVAAIGLTWLAALVTFAVILWLLLKLAIYANTTPFRGRVLR